MRQGRAYLSVLAVSLLVSGTGLRSSEAIAKSPPEQFPRRLVALTTSHDLLATDSNAIVRFLETARPAAVSTEEKARILGTLPLNGEVTDLSASARQKIAVLTELLRATGYESVYQIKVIDVPQAGMGLHARAVIFVSEAALALLDADELQAALAHEMGHGYVWTERERAFQLGDHKRLKDLELVCDAIALVTLHGLGLDVSRLMSGVEKTHRYNKERLGTANNERDYPSLAERKAFARAMAATIR